MTKRITGFFALFDILGFKQILENNDLDYLETRIANLLDSLHKQAVTLDGSDIEQMLSFDKTGTIVFSDTIVLYQTAAQLPDGTMPSMGPSIIDKSALLLRLAFEEGIPLRGAISFGDYLVSENYFLGKPIVEAYQAERLCKWSGAILCKSAECQCAKQRNYRVNWRGLENFLLSPHPCTPDLIIKYSGQYAEPTSSSPTPISALRWDDFILMWTRANGYPPISSNDQSYIEDRVRTMFFSHGKEPQEEPGINDVNLKIKNTVGFLSHCNTVLPLDSRLEYNGE